LGGCTGEGVTTGINLSAPGDEEGEGPDAGETGQQGGITPGEVTKGLEDDEEVILTNQGEIPIDEMAQLVYQHTGEGDIIADQPDEPRPSYQEVHDTLTHGKATPLKGQN